MKTTIITIMFTALSLYMFSENKRDAELKDYVQTDQGIFYLTNLSYELNSFLVGITDKGENMYFSPKEILSYRLDGKVYSKKKLIINGKECQDCTFMEKLITRAGYTIYKHNIYKGNNKLITEFFVYFGNKYELQLNLENFGVVMSFFLPEFCKIYAYSV